MIWKLNRVAVSLAALALSTHAGAGNLWPPRNYDEGVIAEWNALLVSAAPSTAGADMPRYFALMHVAMYDAISSIDRKTAALHSRVPAPRHASTDAAAAQAAHDVLVALFPERKAERTLEWATRKG